MTFGDEVRGETLKNNYKMKEVEEWYPVWSEKYIPKIKKMILSRAKMGDTIRSIVCSLCFKTREKTFRGIGLECQDLLSFLSKMRPSHQLSFFMELKYLLLLIN